MAEGSIFYGVVKTENQFTRLLYNLLLRDSDFRSSFLLFVTANLNTPTVRIDEVAQQTNLLNGGVADLLIETESLSVIIEIKTEEARGLTDRQLIDPDHPNSYISYLAGKAEKQFDAQLIFLIPPNWRYKSDVERAINDSKSKGRTRGVTVKSLTWLDLSERLFANKPPGIGMSLWNELRTLVTDRFTPVRLSRMELEMLNNGHFDLLTAVKLFNIITDVNALAKKEFPKKMGLQVNAIKSAASYFGFEMKHEQAGLLWFGCLPSFPWEKKTPAFCVQGDPIAAEACKKAFGEVLGHYLTPKGEWITAAIPDDDLALGAEHLFIDLQKIWQRIM